MRSKKETDRAKPRHFDREIIADSEVLPPDFAEGTKKDAAWIVRMLCCGAAVSAAAHRAGKRWQFADENAYIS
jgi:hypothetical protein